MKNFCKFLAALAVLVSLAFAMPKTATDPFTVVIDAGHGGKDQGASYNKFTEKEIVANIASKILQFNTDQDVIIHFTRNEDQFVPLTDRVKAINALKPDLVLSLHVNFEKTSKAFGMEFFPNKKANYQALKLENKFVKEGGYKSRGLQIAPFYIIEKADAPAIHFELGFLSNESDRTYLTSEGKQEEIAKAIIEYINELK